MKRTTFPVGEYEANCTIVEDAHGRPWIVDPGADGAEILRRLAGREPSGILLTHAHFDHVGAVMALQEAWPSLPLYVHPADVPMLGHPANAMPPAYPQIPTPHNVRDCRSQDFAEVIETPGHTPGGVCYYFPSDALLFSGDTLFAGSIGRTDFPGGSLPQLLESLKRLAGLPPETVVVPGHGPETTIDTEKRQNRFLSVVLTRCD